MPFHAAPDTDGVYPHPSPGYDFHERTVSRHLVHRASVSEVFITGWQATGPYDFLVGAQWPRSHGFYRLPGDRRHDPVLVAETLRQAALLIGHVGFGVPHDHHFALDELSYRVDPAALAVTAGPASLMLRIGCQDVRMRYGRLFSLRIHTELERDGRPLGQGSVQLRVLTPAAYARLRGGVHRAAAGGRTAAPGVPAVPATPTVPELVGREQPQDVVLSPARPPDGWWLRTDVRHPVLFDQPLDHVPGMLVLEAARQAAQRLHYPEPVAPVELAASFSGFIELDRPCLVRAADEPAGRERQRSAIRVVLEQDGRTAAECRVVTEPLEPAPARPDVPSDLAACGAGPVHGRRLPLAC
ncbi:ScbA/BarX family gamma-butyrolactone biosynthesis protein [Kitasatospora sp. NPDC054939]